MQNIIILILFSFLFNRCSTINQRALIKEVKQLLAKHNLGKINPQCSMSNLSRSGKCVLRNSPKSRGLLDLLIQELQLKDIELVAKKVEAKRQTPEIKPSSEFFEYALY